MSLVAAEKRFGFPNAGKKRAEHVGCRNFPETEIEVRDALLTMRMPSGDIRPACCLAVRSFEEAPTVDEMQQRMKSVTDSGLPYWLRCIAALLSVTATFYRPRLSLYPSL